MTASLSAGGTYKVNVDKSHTVYDLQTAAGATLNITAGTFAVENGTGPDGTSAGTIRVGSNATFKIAGAFTDTATGTVTMAAGAVIDLAGGGISKGVLNLGKGAMLNASAAPWSSSETISNATVNAKGMVTASGGATLLLKDSTINVGGGVLNADAGGAVILDGTSVTGGKLTTTLDGSIKATGAPSTLDGVTIGSGSTVTASLGSTLVLKDTTIDQGTLVANGGTIYALGPVKGGLAIIRGGGTIEFHEASSTHVQFFGTGGELDLSGAREFKGDIAGFTNGDMIELEDFLIGSTKWSYKDDTTNHVTSLKFVDNLDPTHTSVIRFVGDYQKADFDMIGNGAGHLIIEHV